MTFCVQVTETQQGATSDCRFTGKKFIEPLQVAGCPRVLTFSWSTGNPNREGLDLTVQLKRLKMALERS